jgi:glycine cleavage system aminomethyltransferase T
VAVGKVVYTLLLDYNGKMRSDMTVVRLAPDRFRVLSGAGAGPRDIAWLRREARAGRAPTPDMGGRQSVALHRAAPANKPFDVRITDVTSVYGALGLWGPKARDILAATTSDDISNAAFPYYTAREITIGAAVCYALRVSYVGELGWEIYIPTEYATHVWDALWDAGRPHGLIAAGMAAMDSMRIEKGYRRLTFDMDANWNPLEAGMAHVLRFKKDFIGRDALLKIKDQPLTRKLACMTLDRPGDVVMGREPIFADGRVVAQVSSSNTGYSIGKHIAYAYLPVELTQPGQQLEIEYFGQRLPATVAAEPLFDVEGERVKG